MAIFDRLSQEMIVPTEVNKPPRPIILFEKKSNVPLIYSPRDCSTSNCQCNSRTRCNPCGINDIQLHWHPSIFHPIENFASRFSPSHERNARAAEKLLPSSQNSARSE